MPEDCRQTPVRACAGPGMDDCYEWYDSEAFHVKVEDDGASDGSSAGMTRWQPPVRGLAVAGGAGVAPGGGSSTESPGAGAFLAVAALLVAGIVIVNGRTPVDGGGE